MKKLQLSGVAFSLQILRFAGVAGAMIVAVPAAHAAEEIHVWHTMTGANKAEFEKLAKQFGKDQDEVTVKVRAFASQSVLEQEAKAAIASKKAPDLVQLEDNHSPEVVAESSAILPLYTLLARYPIKDLDWFLSATTSFTRDAKGRLLAFPFMAEIPVMFYNTAAYKKAGLNPAEPARTWSGLQAELLKLRDQAESDCPYATGDQVSVHLENLAPINNQSFTSNNNGLAGAKGAPNLQFDTLYMRHIAMMISWKRSQLLSRHVAGTQADAAFAQGDCAVLTTGSGAFGDFIASRSLSFGIAPLPYYEQATTAPGRPFVSGSALWALDGHPKAQEKATAAFLAWLSKPVIAAEWHQRTGYLPLTEAAFRASDVSFYSKIPGAQKLVASMSQQAGPNSRGFRIANYERIAPFMNEQLDLALEGKQSAFTTLNTIADRARVVSSHK